ncbi:hypothetical protein SLOPH_1837, partial [Spraguea lophii 42_110]
NLIRRLVVEHGGIRVDNSHNNIDYKININIRYQYVLDCIEYNLLLDSNRYKIINNNTSNSLISNNSLIKSNLSNNIISNTKIKNKIFKNYNFYIENKIKNRVLVNKILALGGNITNNKKYINNNTYNSNSNSNMNIYNSNNSININNNIHYYVTKNKNNRSSEYYKIVDTQYIDNCLYSMKIIHNNTLSGRISYSSGKNTMNNLRTMGSMVEYEDRVFQLTNVSSLYSNIIKILNDNNITVILDKDNSDKNMTSTNPDKNIFSNFTNNYVTHLIMGKISTSEKFLCALVSGAWILKTSVIDDINNYWMHEWRESDVDGGDKKIVSAIRRWRERINGVVDNGNNSIINILNKDKNNNQCDDNNDIEDKDNECDGIENKNNNDNECDNIGNNNNINNNDKDNNINSININKNINNIKSNININGIYNVKSNYKRRPFYGWKCKLILNNNKYNSYYKLLRVGGAEIVDEEYTHCFVSKEYTGKMEKRMVHVDYILHYLFQK